MALTYNKATRDLAIKGTISFNDGTQENIFGNDILNYSYSAQIGSEGLPLGSTEAASFSLEISNVGRKYTPEKFDNAEVHMFIGIKNGSDYVYSDFGVWYVEDSSAPEQSVSISISGYDALASRFAAVFTDAEDVYPTTIGDIALTVCKAANIPLKDISFPNAAVEVEEMPKWTEGTTLRDILSYCAICAGGFARIALNGQLEIVSFADGATYTVDPDLYQTFTPSGGSAFNFNRIEAFLSEDAEERVPFFINEDIEPNATNALQIDYNPLLTETIVQSIVTELTGITMSAAELTWGGDPSVKCSDYFIVETLNGASTKMMVTAQSVSFEGGLSVTETCSLPTINTITSATYSTSTNMYDAKGNIRATRISGLDKKVITATTGHFENLTAETIETDTLVAKMLSAIELYAGAIKAGSVETDVLTSTLAKIVEATINKLTAGTITTDELYAALAEIMALKVGSLKANDIKTDKLAAALAAFTVISAGTAEFDRATIEHLVANLFNLTGSGVMDDVFIHNLRVAYAQIVSAAIGNLVIKASDGNYYEIDVDASGNVSATLSTVTDGEISAGQTDAGKVILGTDITAESLNTSNLLATYALVNKIDAARIDVDQLWAREAFIAHLQTADISSNSTITIIAGKADKAIEAATNSAKTFRQTTQPLDSESKAGDLWINPANGAIKQAAAVGFAVDGNGNLYLEHSDSDAYNARISTDDPLSMEVNFSMIVAEDGTYSDVPNIWYAVQDQEMLGEIYEKATTGVDLEYCFHDSDTDPPGEDDSGWGTDALPQIENFFIWSRTATTLGDGSVKYGNYICLSTSLGKGVTKIVEQYCRSLSKTVAPTTGWVDGIVERPEGYYIWARSKIIYIDGSVDYTDPYCDTSWEEITSGVDLEYCLWPSDTDAPSDAWEDEIYGWKTTAPAQISGYFIWSRIATTTKIGTVIYSNVTCLSTSLGKGISELVEQYASYSSKTSIPEDYEGWQNTVPERGDGEYIWARTKIIYIDGSVSYTEPYCDTSWESANEAMTAAANAGAVAAAAVEAIGDIPNHVEIKSDGLYLKDENGASTLKINSASVNIGTVAGSAADGFSQFTASYVQFGDYQLRRTTDGGLAFKRR